MTVCAHDLLYAMHPAVAKQREKIQLIARIKICRHQSTVKIFVLHDVSRHNGGKLTGHNALKKVSKGVFRVLAFGVSFAVRLRIRTDNYAVVSDGDIFYIALSHAAKKLVRLLYHLETTEETYQPQKLSSIALAVLFSSFKFCLPKVTFFLFWGLTFNR